MNEDKFKQLFNKTIDKMISNPDKLFGLISKGNKILSEQLDSINKMFDYQNNEINTLNKKVRKLEKNEK